MHLLNCLASRRLHYPLEAVPRRILGGSHSIEKTRMGRFSWWMVHLVRVGLRLGLRLGLELGLKLGLGLGLGLGLRLRLRLGQRLRLRSLGVRVRPRLRVRGGLPTSGASSSYPPL